MESAQSTEVERVKPAELARRLNVSRQAVSQLIQRGILAVDGDGKLAVESAKAAIANNVRPSGKTATALGAEAGQRVEDRIAAGTPGGQDTKYHVARTMREGASAQKAQHKLKTLQASLVDRAQANAAAMAAYEQLQAACAPLGAKVAPLLVTMTEPREIQLAIDAALRACFADFTFATGAVYGAEDQAAPPPEAEEAIVNFQAARTLREVAEARIEQLELLQLRDELADKDQTCTRIFTAYRLLRDSAFPIGRKVAAAVATMSDAGAIQAKIEAALAECFEVFRSKTLRAFAGGADVEQLPPATAGIADGHAEAMRAIAKAMQPDPELHLDVWSEENVVIPKGSAFSGPYRLAHTPYARRVLQCLSPGHPCVRVAVMAASQMLKTQVFINAALGWIALAPANILALEPTANLAKRLSARITKAIEACDAAAEKVAKPRSRDAQNTMDRKEFDGGAIHITTAGAAANLAEIPARYVFCDEVDRMELSVNSEGDPVELAEARGTTYEGQFKAYHVSSPTLLGSSKIATLHAQGTQEQYHVPCPHCQELQPLEQEFFRYAYDPDTDSVDRAWFVCRHCGAEIDEHHKTTMLPDVEMGGLARWVATAQGDGETVSFHINAFYAPLGSISWIRLARQHARALQRKAKGDPSAIQVYENTRLAIPHNNSESTSTVAQMKARAEPYPLRVIPDAALVLTMAVDTQPNRLEVQIEAWGPFMEHWVIDYQVLNGDPSEPPGKPGSVWARLDEIRRTPFAHASGARPIPISAYAIDSGGANTQDVYNYGAARAHVGCLIIKGANRPNKPIISSTPSRVDIDWSGQKTEGGAVLWMIGTDVAKDYIHNRLKLSEGPGAWHYPEAMPDEWYEGVLSERKQVRYVKGHAVREWIKAAGDRNEPLDVSVYNLAVAHHLGLHKWSALDWQRLREKLVPAHMTPDLFSTPTLDQPPQQLPPAAAPVDIEPRTLDTTTEDAPTPAPLPAPPAPAPQFSPLPDFLAQQRPAGRRMYSRGV